MVCSTKGLCISACIAALFAGCATIATQEAATYTPPPPGSTWQMSYRNTGSYGKDADIVTTRTDATWQGTKVAKMTNDAGMSVMILPDSKWAAIVAKDGATLMTFEPPIGFEFPLTVGKSWTTHHKATNYATKNVLEFDYRCTVESLDRVTVRAGTFDAFKVACENEYAREVRWYNAPSGVNVKLDMLRKPGNPNGEGTQQGELVALNLVGAERNPSQLPAQHDLK